jgi:outer membrane protein TolC
MRKILISVLIILLWLPVLAGAASGEAAKEPLVLTLDQAVELALKQNPFHLAVLESEDQARARVRSAFAGFLPSFNAQGQRTLSEKLMAIEFPSMIPGEPPQRIEIDFTRDYQTAFSLSVPVFAGGRILAGYNQSRYGLKASQESIRQSEQETVFNVKRAFYGYLVAKEFVDVAEEALSLAERHFENVKNLYEVGMASKFDLLRSEVQASNLRPQVIRARNGLATAELGLKHVLGVELDRPVEVRGKLAFEEVEIEVNKAIEEALARRPEVRQMDFQVRMAGEMVKMARGAFAPTVSIGGAFNYWADKFSFARGTWSNYYGINLVVTLPIFNGLQNHARLAESKSALRQAELTRKGLLETVELDVRQAALNYEQARETLLSQEKNVEEAREAVRIAELNYQEGLATNLDVSTAQVALSQARMNYTQALYDCVISLAQLEKAVGRGRADHSSN